MTRYLGDGSDAGAVARAAAGSPAAARAGRRDGDPAAGGRSSDHTPDGRTPRRVRRVCAVDPTEGHHYYYVSSSMIPVDDT